MRDAGEGGWTILRDSNVLRSGELISGFMKRIGLADHVIVVLSEKYMRSGYCMSELHSIYQRSVGEKEDFLHRIIPLVLGDAQIGTPEDRTDVNDVLAPRGFENIVKNNFAALRQMLQRRR